MKELIKGEASGGMGSHREQRRSVHHLGQYASTRPHIDTLVVVRGTEEQLGGAVPTSCDLY